MYNIRHGLINCAKAWIQQSVSRIRKLSTQTKIGTNRVLPPGGGDLCTLGLGRLVSNQQKRTQEHIFLSGECGQNIPCWILILNVLGVHSPALDWILGEGKVLEGDFWSSQEKQVNEWQMGLQLDLGFMTSSLTKFLIELMPIKRSKEKVFLAVQDSSIGDVVSE